MSKILVILGLIFVSIVGFLTFYTPKYVEPGHVGIKVHLLGSDKGVVGQQVDVGRHWLTWNERLYVFPTFMQNYTWTGNESFKFNDKDGTSLGADVGISYSIEPEKVPLIFQTYRKGVDEITNVFLRNMVRDALTREASSQIVETIYGEGKEKILDNVKNRVKSRVEHIGIRIEELYWIGEITIPDEIRNALNAKITANQQAAMSQNQVLQRKFEADKKIEDARGVAESNLVEARAQAEANNVITKSLSPELLSYKKLENERLAIERWGGALPTFMGGNSPVPFIDVTGAAPLPKASAAQ